jgi:hypothetical protein
MSMASSAGAECPILVWMLSIHRQISPEVRVARYNARTPSHSSRRFQDYEQCYNLVREALPYTNPRHAPESYESFREWPLPP